MPFLKKPDFIETLLATSISPPDSVIPPFSCAAFKTSYQWFCFQHHSLHILAKNSSFALSVKRAVSTADTFELGLKEPSVHVLCVVGGELAASL